MPKTTHSQTQPVIHKQLARATKNGHTQLDGDGVGDLAVGAVLDHDDGIIQGAVWVLFLNTDGTVKAHQKISDTQGGFTGMLDDVDQFGIDVAALGDLDGDGARDLAVGANRDGDGGGDRGAVWVLFLSDGACEPCDMNCDTMINAFDIEPFLGLLFNGDDPCCGTPGDPGSTGDVNGDGSIDTFDIEPFLNCLFP